MPQGGIDNGEDPAAAALRELAEETGIAQRHDHRRDAGWLRYDLPPSPHRQGLGRQVPRARSRNGSRSASLAMTSEIDITPPTGHKVEFDAWRWVPLTEVADLIVPFKRDVYVQVVAAFAAHARPITATSDADRDPTIRQITT